MTGPRKWTEEEDDLLRNAVKENNGKCWKKIATNLPGRTDVQCLHRWQKVLNPNLIKGPWSKEEDNLLIELVGKLSGKKWAEIAEQLPGRMGKQCRERWYNHLKPEINKCAWTEEEESILMRAHALYGNRWSMIAKILPGRTENSVKNHWNCSLKKKVGSYLTNYSTATHSVVGSCVMNCDSVIPSNQTERVEKTSSTCVETKERVDLSSRPRPRRDSDVHYSGLCYEPIQAAEVDYFYSTGKFPSRSLSMDDSFDVYSWTRSIQRLAMTYKNVPSILRRS